MITNNYQKNIIFPMSDEEIISVPVEKRIFIFWQSYETDKIPGYISLCLHTLIKFNPDYRVIFLNYNNIYMLLGDIIDWDKFVHMQLMHQSDVIMVCFLFKYGGHFVDADIIYTGKIDWLNTFPKNNLVGISKNRGGNSPKVGMRLALMSARETNNTLIFHILQMQKYKASITPIESLKTIEWDYFGNSIVDPIAKFYKNSSVLSLVSDDLFLPERHFLNSVVKDSNSRQNIYNDFYFKMHDIAPSKIISFAEYGMLLLHNSLTEQKYKDLSASEFIKQDFFMAELFRTILGCELIDERDFIKIPWCNYQLRRK